MATTNYSVTDLGNLALAGARKDTTSLLTRTFRDAEAEFRQGVGTTVQVRVRGFKANAAAVGNKATPLTVSDVNEANHDVALTDTLYVRALASQEDLYSLEAVAGAVIVPAVAAITDQANAKIAALYNGLTPHSTITWAENDARGAVIDARAALLAVVGDLEGAPLYVEASPAAYADLLKAEALDRMPGLQVFESTRITEDAFVIHTARAVASALRAPVVSAEAAKAASVKADDDTFAVTVVRGYSTEYASEDVLTHVLYGASLMGEPKFDAADGSVAFVPSALRIAKAA